MASVCSRRWLAVRPGQLSGASRLAAYATVAVLCLAIAAPLAVATRYAYVQRDLVLTVFDEDAGALASETRSSRRKSTRGRARRGSMSCWRRRRPGSPRVAHDTVILASIDTATGNAVLFSLPRNLERAPFPPGSELAQKYPRGFPDFLNAIYPTVIDSPNLLAGVPDKGIRAVKDAVGEILGLPVDYYLMVDLEGFREVVDALGGITVNVEERVSYGAIKASGAIGRSQGFIEPGLQQMDGETALLYARSRDFATDYDRMARQRCVVNAIVDTADPVTVFRSYPQIAGTLREHLQTDIPAAASRLRRPRRPDQGGYADERGVRAAADHVGQSGLRVDPADRRAGADPVPPGSGRRGRHAHGDPDRASRAGRDHHTDAGSDTGAAGQPRYRLLGPNRTGPRPRLFGGPMSGREAAPFRGPIGYECGTVPESVRGCTGVCFDGQAHAPVRRRGRATSMMPPPPGWHRRTTGNHTQTTCCTQGGCSVSGNRSERRSLSDLLAERHGSEPTGSAAAFQAPSPDEETAAPEAPPENRTTPVGRPGSMAARLAATRKAQQERLQRRPPRGDTDKDASTAATNEPAEQHGVSGVAHEAPAAAEPAAPESATPSLPLPTRKRRYALDPARLRPDWPPRGALARLAGRPPASIARRSHHRWRRLRHQPSQ